MHFTHILGAAVLGAGLATADFMVYTEAPIPTSAIPTFSNPSQATSWSQNVFINALRAYQAWETSGGSAYQSSKSSAQSEISAFVASNANYSIPSPVTEITGPTTTFQGAPTWYSALPSGAREFKEKQVSAQFSVVREEISQRAKTGGAGSSGPSATSQGGAVVQTPAAAMLGLGGMGMAVAAGVFF